MIAQTVSRPTNSAVVFDGDDTLWSTEPLYDEARANARSIVSDAGLDGAEWERIERRVDVENVAKYGFSPVRFPNSCVEAYYQLCHRSAISVDASVVKRVESAAQNVFVRTATLIPHAREVLACLHQRGLRLALLTKGDAVVQRNRVDTSGLAGLFHVIRIVADKTPATIRDVVQELGGNPTSSWMVGNSVRSDIVPALAAGLRAIWIDAHVWEHERSHDSAIDERVIVLKALRELPSVIEH
jgi:putative hydrolase of the HAD superfamily